MEKVLLGHSRRAKIADMRTTAFARDNEGWIQALGSDGQRARLAYEDLRAILQRALARALADRIDDSTIDDVVQEACLKVASNLASFRGDSKFTTWAVAIAVRTAYTELRRARWRDIGMDDLNLRDAVKILTQRGADDDIERKRILQVMHAVIATELTERQRTALMAELAGMPQSVLCERLGTNRNALYKLGHDARKALRRGMVEAGISDEEVQSAFNL